jgi:hypothetical protein
MKTLIFSIVSLILGIFIGYLVRGGSNQTDLSWERIKEYHAHINNPSNYEIDGKSATVSIPDITIDLAILTQKGELVHRKVIIPEIPNTGEYIKDWMVYFQDKYPDVVEVSGPGSYQKGEIPLMFEVWHKPHFKKELDEYIEHLKKKSQKNINKNSIDTNEPSL